VTNAAAKQGMPPVGPTAARLLILGSLPGDESIRQQQYYAHPQNQFWRMLCAVFDEPICASYAERLNLLNRHRIAVWDAAHSASRRGSLDSAITAPIANDFASFFESHIHIEAIAFNGQKAAALFKSCVEPTAKEHAAAWPTATLPSTSPAAARLTFDDKVAKWRAFLLAHTPTVSHAAHPTAKRSGSTYRP